jgi:hypothetical protein
MYLHLYVWLYVRERVAGVHYLFREITKRGLRICGLARGACFDWLRRLEMTDTELDPAEQAKTIRTIHKLVFFCAIIGLANIAILLGVMSKQKAMIQRQQIHRMPM